MKTATSTNTTEITTERKIIKTRKNFHKFNELFNYLENHKTTSDTVLLSIILPMYNEEKTIRAVLESLPKNKLIEILVIDDHSTDDSIKEIGKINSQKRINILHHEENKGYGAAITTGMKHAKGKVVVCMDSDGQHSADDLYGLIKPIIEGESDLVIGSRYLGAYNYRLPLLRQFGEILAEKIIRILFNLKIKNNQNGFRAYNRKILEVLKYARYLDYTYCTEQILKASIYGFKVKESPIKVYGRQHGASKMTIIRLALNIFSCLLLFYFKKIKVIVSKKR
ncbi:MAG: glycosyltransferase family 2 protein [Candidatus Hermodarchaeota archaeon]